MWYIIGILPWLIIFWLAVPGTFTATVIVLLIGLFGILVLWLLARLTDKQAEAVQRDRENAIQEWERKWKRPHPSRKITNSSYNAKQKR